MTTGLLIRSRGSHRRGQSSLRMGLRLVPMIDVTFQLLIFFLLGANFRSQEGFLPAELPSRVVRAAALELEPLPVRLETQADGTCRVAIGEDVVMLVRPDQVNEGFGLLGEKMLEVINAQARNLDDPVKLMPTRSTSWDHVVKAYDVLWQIGLKNIVFVMVG